MPPRAFWLLSWLERATTMSPKTNGAQVSAIIATDSSQTPSAKAIVTATVSTGAWVTQDANILNQATSLDAPRPLWVHPSAFAVTKSFSYSPHPAITMKPRTRWVQTVALPTNSAVVLAHAPPGSGARVILAVTRQHYLRPRNARSTSQRTQEDPTDAKAATNALVCAHAPTMDGA